MPKTGKGKKGGKAKGKSKRKGKQRRPKRVRTLATQEDITFSDSTITIKTCHYFWNLHPWSRHPLQKTYEGAFGRRKRITEELEGNSMDSYCKAEFSEPLSFVVGNCTQDSGQMKLVWRGWGTELLFWEGVLHELCSRSTSLETLRTKLRKCTVSSRQFWNCIEWKIECLQNNVGCRRWLIWILTLKKHNGTLFLSTWTPPKKLERLP